MAEKKAEEFQTAATRVSLVSMITNVVLTLLKLAAGLLAHSGAMISDAVHSASDIFSGLIVLLGVKISTKEPDEQHPYGHERYECVAALLLSGILAVVGGAIGIGAVKDISAHDYEISDLKGVEYCTSLEELYCGYNYLTSNISDLVFKMESATIDFMDLLHEPADKD